MLLVLMKLLLYHNANVSYLLLCQLLLSYHDAISVIYFISHCYVSYFFILYHTAMSVTSFIPQCYVRHIYHITVLCQLLLLYHNTMSQCMSVTLDVSQCLGQYSYHFHSVFVNYFRLCQLLLLCHSILHNITCQLSLCLCCGTVYVSYFYYVTVFFCQ